MRGKLKQHSEQAILALEKPPVSLVISQCYSVPPQTPPPSTMAWSIHLRHKKNPVLQSPHQSCSRWWMYQQGGMELKRCGESWVVMVVEMRVGDWGGPSMHQGDSNLRQRRRVQTCPFKTHFIFVFLKNRKFSGCLPRSTPPSDPSDFTFFLFKEKVNYLLNYKYALFFN